MHAKSGEVKICSIVKHDTGGTLTTKRHVISRDTVNRGPVNQGITVLT